MATTERLTLLVGHPAGPGTTGDEHALYAHIEEVLVAAYRAHGFDVSCVLSKVDQPIEPTSDAIGQVLQQGERLASVGDPRSDAEIAAAYLPHVDLLQAVEDRWHAATGEHLLVGGSESRFDSDLASGVTLMGALALNYIRTGDEPASAEEGLAARVVEALLVLRDGSRAGASDRDSWPLVDIETGAASDDPETDALNAALDALDFRLEWLEDYGEDTYGEDVHHIRDEIATHKTVLVKIRDERKDG